MKAFANTCAALPSEEGVSGKGLTRRTAGKPLRCFADTPALVGIEKIRSDNKVVDKTAAGAKRGREQVSLSTRKRNHRSMPGDSQVVADGGLSDALTGLAGPPEGSTAKADAGLVPPSKAPKDQRSFATDRSGKLTDSAVAAMTGGSIARPRAECRLPVTASHTPRRTPGDTSVDTTTGVRATLRENVQAGVHVRAEGKAQAKVEVGTAKPVSSDVGHQARPEVAKDDSEGVAAITQTERRHVPEKGEPAVARQPVENRQHAQGGRNAAAKSGESSAAVASWPLLNVHRSATPPKPDQVAPNASSTSHDVPVEAPQKSASRLEGLHSVSQHRWVSKGDGAPPTPAFKVPVLPSSGKGVRPGSQRDGLNVQTEPPPPSLGQPVTAVSPPSMETQTHQIADVHPAENPVRNVSEQILDSVRVSVTQGDRQIVVRLQPPEMGTVVVRFREQGEHLDGIVEVARSDTRRQIEQALPEVVRSLHEAGIPVRRFEVTASDPSEQGFGRGLSQQDASAGQHGSGQGRDHLPASRMSWSWETLDLPVDSQDSPSAGRQADTPHDRIDLLL